MVYETLVDFFSYFKNQFAVSVKVMRSDNGTEIVQEVCTGNLQQNARVERKNKHLVKIARAVRLFAHLPTMFWGDCILVATYLINKMPTYYSLKAILMLKKLINYMTLTPINLLLVEMLS
ncbi:hypothetical protein V2J09_016993 [Rumex salicifolius]